MNNRNAIIDNLRGLCMLGVIAIHTGSNLALALNPNSLLYLFYEVLSRYSVPGFFFISGFGLFTGYPLDQPLHYFTYIKKRLRSVGLPYLTWSLLYLAYYSYITPGSIDWSLGNLLFTLFFGLASYHIYFMVILLWFYLLFPLWRNLLRLMHKSSLVISILVLGLAQMVFNYWTCHFWAYPAWIANNTLLLNLFNYRLNYLPLHYLFVFLLGALAAIHYEAFIRGILANAKIITLFWITTVGLLISRAYYLLYFKNYSLENITNTLQQLSSEGFLYTIASMLFFSLLLLKANSQSPVFKWCRLLSINSLIIYLIHPFFLDQISYILPLLLSNANYLSIATYFSVLFFSLLASIIILKLLRKTPLLSRLLIGR
ncbi:MAG TPA: acyltransferase [Candidatus Dorea intestinavium]|nr:acyltransferase [Candidatus Dorea intestinavium]